MEGVYHILIADMGGTNKELMIQWQKEDCADQKTDENEHAFIKMEMHLVEGGTNSREVWLSLLANFTSHKRRICQIIDDVKTLIPTTNDSTLQKVVKHFLCLWFFLICCDISSRHGDFIREMSFDR